MTIHTQLGGKGLIPFLAKRPMQSEALEEINDEEIL